MRGTELRKNRTAYRIACSYTVHPKKKNNIIIYFFSLSMLSVPPRIHHISSGGHMQVKKGASVRIECSASGRFSYLHIFTSFAPTLFISVSHWMPSIHSTISFSFFTGNPSPNITWTKKFENLPNGKKWVFFFRKEGEEVEEFYAIKEINRYTSCR